MAKSLNLLNSPDLVIQTCGIINALESFGFELFFETGLLLALVRKGIHSFVGDSSRHLVFTPFCLSIEFLSRSSTELLRTVGTVVLVLNPLVDTACVDVEKTLLVFLIESVE